ncbi:MAG TPA: glutathione S-transferase [Xanthobacteraceae bacterium]|nr:glutathione S-transferase [Xanthobacteraceae bacterium]
MKLYDGGRAPSPRRVRIFLAEKGVDVPKVPVDLAALEQKSASFRALNPMQRVPVLELDDGTVITETMAICRYFEALHPQPNLFGRDAVEIAKVEMWNRRLELGLYTAVSSVFRHGHPGMAKLQVPQVQEWAEINKPQVAEFLQLLDRELASRKYAAVDRFTVADITGLVAIDLMKPAKLEVPEACKNVRRWHAEISARPSAAA